MQTRFKDAALLTLLLAGNGCSASPKPPQATAAAPTPRNPQPAQVAVATPSAATVPTPSRVASARAITAEASPFHLVGIGGTVIAAEDKLYLYDGAQLVAEVVGDTVTNHPEYLASYPATSWMESVVYVGGQWPNHAYVAVTRPAQRSSYTIMMKKVGSQWKELTRTQVAEWVQGVIPWNRGRRIALVSAMYGYYRWEVVEGAPRSVPLPTRAGEGACCGPNSTAQIPVDFAALPSGHLFAVGARVDEQSAWVVERWAPNVTHATMDRLPQPEGEGLEVEVTGLHAISAEDVYAYGQLRRRRSDSTYLKDTVSGYLAHFDGRSWAQLPFAETSPIVSVAVDGDELWLASGGKLLRQSRGKAQFEQVALPAVNDSLKTRFHSSDKTPLVDPWSYAISEVLVRKDHDLWVTAQLQHGKVHHGPVLFRNRPHPEVWDGLGNKDYAQTMEQYKALRPADENCQTIFVLLYGMTRNTPKDYDYPLTRKAVKGHPEFRDVVFAETEELGKRYFGAFVPDFEIARKLVKLVATKVPGATPQALCRNPKKIRLLEIDLATGTVLTNGPVPAEAQKP